MVISKFFRRFRILAFAFQKFLGELVFSVRNSCVFRAFSLRFPFILLSFSVQSAFVLRSDSVQSAFVFRSFSVHSFITNLSNQSKIIRNYGTYNYHTIYTSMGANSRWL